MRGLHCEYHLIILLLFGSLVISTIPIPIIIFFKLHLLQQLNQVRFQLNDDLTENLPIVVRFIVLFQVFPFASFLPIFCRSQFTTFVLTQVALLPPFLT